MQYMKFGRTGLAAAAVAAAAVLSACSTSTAGVPQGAPAVQGQAVASPETAAVAPAAGPAWVDVTGQGVVQRDDSATHDQWNSVPEPGIKIGRVSTTDPSGSAKCTLGPAVTDGTRQGFLTAGHCADGKAATVQYAQVHPDGSAPLELGPEQQAEDTDTGTGWSDSGVVWTPTAAGETRIAGAWTVVGSMSTADVRALPLGTPICVDGAASGVVCGGLVTVGDDIRFRRAATVDDGGDSGAPVFTVDQRGQATLIGLFRGNVRGDDSVGVATFIAPALARLNATVQTAG